MNGKDLLVGLGYIHSSFFEEAETGVLASPAPSRHKSLRRPLLVAAIIALTLLLVGCAVVYALRLQDMSVGKETYTQKFDEDGKYIDPVEKTKDILVFTAPGNESLQQALLEWFDYLESYDPDGELMTNDPALPHIPDRYEYTYGCYTQDMVNKVDEIAEKYSLKLLDTWIPFQRYQSHIFLEETGIGSLLLPDSGAEVKGMAGMLYPPYNFHMEFSLVTDSDPNGLLASVSYERNDYFPHAYIGSRLDLSTIAQWDYTTRDGTQVLLALSNKGQGYIIGESGNGMVYIFIDGNRSRSAYPGKSEIVSREELEMMADLFDYSMEPAEIDRTTIEARLSETAEAYKAEHAYVPEVYGSFNDYLINNAFRDDPRHQYTFYDLTGDGVDELLLGYNGSYNIWLTLKDGEVIPQMTAGVYLCEGPVIELSFRDNDYYDYEEHFYYAPISDTVIDDVDRQTSEQLDSIVRKQKQWYRLTEENYLLVETPISEEEASAVFAKYPRMQLDWKPLTEYPLDADGYTMGDYLKEKDVRVSDEELLSIYKDFLSDEANDFYTHYRILDINGDGVADLLLSGDGEKFWDVWTYRFGTVTNVFVGDFYLCADGVLVSQSIDYQDTGVEVETQEFWRYNEFSKESLAYIAYNKATASWQSDYHGTPMEEAEVNGILKKYPRIDPEMHLISELLN